MFVVEIEEALLDSLGAFLTYIVPGRVTRSGGQLQISFDGTLDIEAQRRILERLIWAWRVERDIGPVVPHTLTHLDVLPQPPTGERDDDRGSSAVTDSDTTWR